MEEEPLDPQDVERAKTFWAEEDVDQVFDGIFDYLDYLKRVLKKNAATDKEYVQGLKLLEALNSPLASAQDSSVVQVVIGADECQQPAYSPSPPFPPSGESSCSAAPPAGREEDLQPPLTPNQLQYQLHPCTKSCLPSLPSMPHSATAFWGQNPLKVPLLCGFRRLSAVPLMMSPGGDGDAGAEQDVEDWDVVYKTPCGLSLRNHDDVMRFLLATESYDVMQIDFFTFNPCVRLDPPQPAGPRRPEMDLSRGVEPTPVQLCLAEGGARPAEFRYRKERWPHGCFLSRGPTLFAACCDCTDGCSDPQLCACVAATNGGRHYSHHRLTEPVTPGVFECGPWCDCVGTRCQNRLVQRGITVRLQVFQTGARGWGVRCRDDLDHGTFVCIYAGVMLRRAQSPSTVPSLKLARAELPSDDEVEVVTEWLAPPVQEGRGVPEPTGGTPTSHVTVIQRHTDNNGASTPHDRDKSSLAGSPEEKVAVATGGPEGKSSAAVARATKSLKRALKEEEDVYILDASKEGNVSRFINHSCQPNLFLQNVFTDTHDPGFPVIAFFTNRVVAAGTELTWNYSADTQRKQEVPCLCGSDGCRGRFVVEETLCDTCEVEGQTETQ
ncbi:histone-lysine N-methyltransferase SETDB2 isoform X1 [Sander vitreus]